MMAMAAKGPQGASKDKKWEAVAVAVVYLGLAAPKTNPL
jgi:hypothetical protein